MKCKTCGLELTGNTIDSCPNCHPGGRELSGIQVFVKLFFIVPLRFLFLNAEGLLILLGVIVLAVVLYATLTN